MVAFASSPTTESGEYVPLFWKFIALVSLPIAAFPLALFITLMIGAYADFMTFLIVFCRQSTGYSGCVASPWTDLLCCTVGVSYSVWTSRRFAGIVVFLFLAIAIQKVTFLFTGRYLEMFRASNPAGGDNVLLLLYPPCSRPHDCPPVLWQSFYP